MKFLTANALKCLLLGSAWAALSGPLPAQEPDYSAELPRVAPLAPSDELRSFDVQPGFRVELVAAEPLVKDPVAFAFNGQGHLFVVEMCDYSEQETEHLGSIARLVDVDHDGLMDQRSTFAEGLSWPTAIWPWQDGVLVAEPPNLIWLRDTDGNGVSDQREVWYTGFGRSNVQGLVNSLRWTVEGFIQGATSSSGATLTQGDDTAYKTLTSLRGRDFVLDPLNRRLQAASGGGQHGMAFNRWGDKFVTSNSDHLQQIIDLDAWLDQHSLSVPVPPLRRSIAVDGPQAEVFRASPVEPWRIVRTRLRVSGAVPGIVEGGGRAAGYFTGATGTWIMDREAGFGDEKFDTALVCDVGSNLVHRKRLIPAGLFWSGERIDTESELLRSSDIWFRPVQLGDGPDGALYIADMYREVIEHPQSLPPVIKKHLDLTSGRDRGRIWRVAPTTATTVTAINTTIMPAQLSSSQLAGWLHHPVTWQRRMASQLLVERGDATAVPALENSAQRGRLPEGRILALHVLERYGKLSDAVLEQTLSDGHPRVVAHAVALVGTRPDAASFAEALQRVPTADPHVRLALSMVAERLPPEEKLAILRKLMPLTAEPLTRATIIISAGDASPELFAGGDEGTISSEWLKLVLPAWIQTLQAHADADSPLRQTLARLLMRDLAEDTASRPLWAAAFAQLPNRAAADTLLSVLDEPTRSSFHEFVAQRAQDAITTSAEHPDQAQTLEALAWLRLVPIADLNTLSGEALSPTAAEPVQLAYTEALLWNDPEAAFATLLPELKRMTPGLKREVLLRVAGYAPGLVWLADALEQNQLVKAEIAPDVRQQLFAVPDAQVAERFKKLLTTASSDRAQVIERYRDALSDISELSPQQIASGRMTFQRICAQCHRLEELGNDVGPPLKQLGDKSPEQLLDIVLDPNREVDPKFLGYSVLLADGRVLAGIIREESAGQIVLAESGGKQHTIARSEIAQLKTTGLSLMPVGLEEQISPEQMRELIGYLKQAGSK